MLCDGGLFGADLSDGSAATALIGRCQKRPSGSVDILVNNAGINMSRR